MNEADLQQWLLGDLKRINPKRVVLNHADHSTKGVPDFTVTQLSRTTWFEIKYVRSRYKELLSERVFYLQNELMRRLHKHGHAWYVVFVGEPEIMRTEIWTPSELLKKVEGFEASFVSYINGKSSADVDRLATGGSDGLRSLGA